MQKKHDIKETAERQRKALRSTMEKYGLNPYSWARKAGLTSSSSLSNFLYGRSNSLTIKTIDRLAKAIGVPSSEIIGDATNFQREPLGLDLEVLDKAEEIATSIISKDKNKPDVKQIREFIKVLYDILVKEKSKGNQPVISEPIAEELWRLHAGKR